MLTMQYMALSVGTLKISHVIVPGREIPNIFNPNVMTVIIPAYFYEKLEQPGAVMSSIKYAERSNISILSNQLFW